jgi:PhnB protein
MSFYRDCLGGELTLQAIKDTPLGAQCKEGTENDIMHSTLQKDGLLLMASDMIGPEGLHQGNNMSLCVNCSSEEEIRTFFQNLSSGGTVIDPLKQQFWGALFGVLTDKFGIRWLFNYDPKGNG